MGSRYMLLERWWKNYVIMMSTQYNYHMYCPNLWKSQVHRVNWFSKIWLEIVLLIELIEDHGQSFANIETFYHEEFNLSFTRESSMYSRWHNNAYIVKKMDEGKLLD